VGTNVSSARITFTKSKIGIQSVIDVEAYSAEKTSFALSAYNLVFCHDRSFFAYFFYIILIALIIFLTGALVTKPLEKRISAEEIPVVRFAAGIVATGLFGLLFYLLPASIDLRSFVIIFYLVWIPLCLKFGSFRNMGLKNPVYVATAIFAIFLIMWTFYFDGGRLFLVNMTITMRIKDIIV